MAEAEKHRVERVVQPLGADWGKAIQDQIVEVGAAYAEAQLKGGKYRPADNYIEVTVPVSVKLRFPVLGDRLLVSDAGAPDAGAHCFCTWKPFPEGGGVCICRGLGAGDPSCDCPPETLPQ